MHSLLLLLRRAARRCAAPLHRRAEWSRESASETGNFNELLQRFGVAGAIGTLPRAPRRLGVRTCTYTSRWRSASRGCCEPRSLSLSLSLPGYYADLLVRH